MEIPDILTWERPTSNARSLNLHGASRNPSLRRSARTKDGGFNTSDGARCLSFRRERFCYSRGVLGWRETGDRTSFLCKLNRHLLRKRKKNLA